MKLLVGIFMACVLFTSCKIEDKGVTDKFIEKWNLTYYKHDDYVYINQQGSPTNIEAYFKSCVISISKEIVNKGSVIYNKTEEFWQNGGNKRITFPGSIRFEKNNVIEMTLFDKEFSGIYTIYGNSLTIKGSDPNTHVGHDGQSYFALYELVLERYSN